MEFIPRHRVLQAKLLAVLDEHHKPTEEKAYLVEIDGTRELLDAYVFEMLFQPQDSRIAHQPKVVTASGREPRNGSVAEDVLKCLATGPKSSMELIRALKCEAFPHRVYQATAVLKETGVILADDDPVDGRRRWFINTEKGR